MLNWQLQPDEAFNAIVDSALVGAIDLLSEAMAQGHTERHGEGSGGADPLWMFSEQVTALFDAEQLLAELRKLLQAHRSPKLSMPSDVHFLLLYKVLQHQIEVHNDRVFATGQPVACGDVRLLLIDFAFVCDFFWDLDFLLEPEVMERASEDVKQRLGFSPETFGVVQGLKPHPQELELREVPDERLPGENHSMPGSCYPWFKEDGCIEEEELTTEATGMADQQN